MKLTSARALVPARIVTGNDSEMSGVEDDKEERSVENAGGSRPSETMRIGCGVCPPNRQPRERTR